MDTSNSIRLAAPAKLNLFLHINRKRGMNESFPGYHELQTIFQILDYGDTLTFVPNDQSHFSISPSIEGVSLEDNLIYKAAIALKTHAITQGKVSQELGADIELEKRLPMGGGLGGGSSNAATTLLALNQIWGLHFSIDELARLGAKLGADVPVFVRGHSAHAEGIGEALNEVLLSPCWYVVLYPETHISTAKIFSHERLTRDTPKKRIAPALEGQALDVISELMSDSYRNDFETLITELYPEVHNCIRWLSQYGPARMTGTGACCFCPVTDESTAQKVLNEARSKFKGFIAKGVNLSPAHQRLNEAD